MVGSQMLPSPSPDVFVFGVFRLDLHAGELTRAGSPVRLRPQAVKVLGLLVRRAGELVTRAELQKAVWGPEVNVEFDLGLNACVKQVRAALRDTSDVPRYVETLPRRGYRFVAPVRQASDAPVAPDADGRKSPWPSRGGRRAAAALLTVAAFGGFGLRAFGDRTSTEAHTRAPRLLVAPFADLGEEPGQEYVAAGFTEELTTQLGRTEPARLVVVSSPAQPPRTARAAGPSREADYVLEGSVRAAGQRLRITAKLVRPADGRQVWSESYDRPRDDLLRVQSEVAHAVVTRIRAALGLQPATQQPGVLAADSEAYRDYLRGRFSWNLRTLDGVRGSIVLFERALARDPGLAPAWVGLADASLVMASYKWEAPAEALPKARRAGERALQIDPLLPEAHATLAVVAFDEWRFAEAEEGFRRAIELNPSYATAHQWYGGFLRAQGRLGEALAESRRAVELDPLSGPAAYSHAVALLSAGRAEEALATLAELLAIHPTYPPAHFARGRVLMALGRTEEAKGSARRAVELAPDVTYYRAFLGVALARTGNEAAARRVVEALRALSRRRYVSSFDVALVHAALGERERALAALEAAHDGRDTAMPFAARHEAFASLRAEPRFVALALRPRPAAR